MGDDRKVRVEIQVTSTVDVPAPIAQAVWKLCQLGERIEAIKLMRGMTDMHLREAQDVCDKIADCAYSTVGY
jgi:ribosomal protein L7/L12